MVHIIVTAAEFCNQASKGCDALPYDPPHNDVAQALIIRQLLVELCAGILGLSNRGHVCRAQRVHDLSPLHPRRR